MNFHSGVANIRSADATIMSKLIDYYCRALTCLMVLTLALMVALVFGNVVLRYVFNSGITVSEEVSRWLFVWLTFLGAIVALKEHGHLGSDMVVSRLPVLGKKAFLLIGHLLMLYITWLLFSGSLQQARINWDVQAPVSGASVAIFYSAGVVFAVSAGVILLRDLWRALCGQLSEAELVMVKESEEAGELEELQAELAREQGGTPAHLQNNTGSKP
jgi:TRAP-type transport system small permease protein